jgi:SEC-C motif-containing protein
MRSRYSAFALKNPKYIINTTHKNNKDFTKDTDKWIKDIQSFTNSCEFNSLQILEFIDGENKALVSFRATIHSNGEDCSFSEKSEFIKENYKWFYLDGVFL